MLDHDHLHVLVEGDAALEALLAAADSVMRMLRMEGRSLPESGSRARERVRLRPERS
jgi:hypothetical protein